jgi:hypothetical protein
MGKTKEQKELEKQQKAAQKATKKAERKEKWNATKEKAKEKFSKLGSKVKKVFKPEDKSDAQQANAEVFETAVSDLNKLRLVLSTVRNSAGDMFIKDGSNAKTYVDQAAFDQYNNQIKALSKRIIEIKNRINASVEGLHEKESRSESLKTLNTLNTILTRIAEVLDRISEVDLPAGENYSEPFINELRQLISRLDLFLKNIKSISKKHAVFGGPALKQLTNLRAILNLLLSDFTETIVQINNTMDNTSKPKSFKYSTRLDDGTKVGVKAISGDVGKVVTNKRELKRDDITRLLDASSQISDGERRASEIQRILRSAEHDLQVMFADIRSNVSAVHRTGLGAADQMLNEYLEHLMELLRRLEALYHANEYPDPSTFKDQLTSMISKAENMKKKVRNLLKKLSSKVQKTSQYSNIIEILDAIDQSVDDMVNADGLVIPEQPAEENPDESAKDDVVVDDNHSSEHRAPPDIGDTDDDDRSTTSKANEDESPTATPLRPSRRGSESGEDDRADYLYNIITGRQPPPEGITRFGASKELKKLAKTSRHAEELLMKCPKLQKISHPTQTEPKLHFEQQDLFDEPPKELPPARYLRKKPTRPPSDLTHSRRSSDTRTTSDSSVPRSPLRQTPRHARSRDSLEFDNQPTIDYQNHSENSVRSLTLVLNESMTYQNKQKQMDAYNQLQALAKTQRGVKYTLERYAFDAVQASAEWAALKSQVDNDCSRLSDRDVTMQENSTIMTNLSRLAKKYGGYATRMYDKARKNADDLACANIGPDRAASDICESSLPKLDKLDAILCEHLNENNKADLTVALQQLIAKAKNKKDPENTKAKELLEFHGMGMESDMARWLASRRLLDTHLANIENGAHSQIQSDSEKAQTSFRALQALASQMGGYAEKLYNRAASEFGMKSETDSSHRSMHSSASYQMTGSSDNLIQSENSEKKN